MKHHLIAIGVSQHKNSGANLAFAEKDATEFFTLFKNNIADIGYARLLVNQEATFSEIKTALGEELKREVKPDDAFIFFYSGHGALVADPDDQNVALSFLVPYDATHDIANSCLSIDHIKSVFESLASKTNLIFIDSCFSGAASKQDHGKSYPTPNMKSFKTLKSFTNTVVGNGSVIFTASKDDELSLEDPEYKNGLFTYNVLQELQKKRPQEDFSAMEIFSPIVDKVGSRAKEKWHHTQTPTFAGKMEGDLRLPVFKKKLSIRPEILEIPKTPELEHATFPVPTIDLSIKEKDDLVQATSDFVINSSGKPPSLKGEIALEKLCHDLMYKIKEEWEEIFIHAGRDIKKIPEAISKMEASCYQFMILGAAICVYGTEKQVHIYSQVATLLFDLTKKRSGYTALIAIPEVIIVEIIYIFATICVARSSFRSLQILLETTYDDPNFYDRPPITLLEYNHPHYTQALTGKATTVNGHVRDYLKSQDWLTEFAPTLAGKTDDYQLQANFLLTMLTLNVGENLWPDFARYYTQRVLPFTKKLLYCKEVREDVAQIMGLREEELLSKLREYISKLRERGLGSGYWWDSITEENLMSEEEKEEAASE